MGRPVELFRNGAEEWDKMVDRIAELEADLEDANREIRIHTKQERKAISKLQGISDLTREPHPGMLESIRLKIYAIATGKEGE